jgi:outer membrane protein TolC
MAIQITKHNLAVAHFSIVMVMVMSGCGLDEWARNGAKVGPNYQTPPAAVARNWIDYQDQRVSSAQHEQDLSQWWNVFNDPALTGMIDHALRQNLSLRAAGERIVESRARRGIAVGNLFPQQQEAAGAYTANKVSNQNGGNLPGGVDQYFQNWNAGFNVSWELDLWGRFRRGIEAADADLDAAVADFDNVLVVLLADVTANYIQYRTFQERIAVARRNIEIQEKSYQLASDKFGAGSSTERDAQQSKQVLEQTRASIPALEAGARQASNALCVLLGIPPQDLTNRLGGLPATAPAPAPTTVAATATAPATMGVVAPMPAGVHWIPTAPAELALGIPAELLRRRPDVRAFERRAAAQSALIGIAKADVYPRFSIDGSIGVSAEDFGDLFKTPGSLSGFVGPSFRWDILNYGRIGNNVLAQEARFRELVFNYQDAVLRANREAEDAIIGFLKAQERTRYLEQSVAAAARTVQISHDQYREGVIDFTPVYLFEGTLAEQQDALAAAQGQIALSLVDLYRALGGGWEMRMENGGGKPATTQPAPARAARAATTGPAVSQR